MALSTITVTVDSTPYDFDVANVSQQKTVRLDVEHGDLTNPLAMTHDNQLGSALKPDRRLVRIDYTKTDSDSGESATVSAHTVFTVPRHPAITTADAVLAYEILHTYLTPTIAAAIMQGQLQ